MKRKALLIMLLMAMVAPLAMFGQQTLTVCEGTTTNEYVPFYGYYADDPQQNQMIFPAMRAMNGTNITEMVFDCYSVASAQSGGLGNWIVSLGETDATTLSGLDNSTALTQVYSGELTVNASAKQVIVTFTTPYLYNGGNLLVEFNHPVTTGYRRISFYGTEATGAAYTYDEVRDFLPQTTFTYLPADYCFTPSGITSETTPVSATIDWSPEADAYNIRYRVNANSQAEVLLSTDFENGLPTGWTTIDSDGDGFNWDLSTNVGNFNCNSGTACMISASYDDDNQTALTPDNWLVTPQVALGGSISFYSRGQDASWCGEHFAVYVSTTSQTDTRSFTQVSQEYVATGSYQEYVVDLSNYSGNGYIAIRHFNITDMFYLNVDDVTVYGPATQNAWTTINNTTTKPYTIEGLTPETTYDVEVQAVCSATSSSDWSETAQFTTPSNCMAPFGLEADEITQTSASLSWTGYQDSFNVQYRIAATAEVLLFNDFEGTSSVSSWTQSDGAVYNGDGLQYSGSTMYGFTAGEEQYLITPELTGLEDGGTLVFYHMYYSNTAESFMVGYSSTTADARAFTWSNSVTSGSSFSAYVEAIPAGTKYIAIQTTIAQYYLFIEDFTVYGPTIPAGEWVSILNTTSPVAIDDLEADTDYEFQVQGINTSCDGGVTDWSESGYFTTPSANMFVTDGNWNVASNWYSGEVPADGADVTISANAIIPKGYTAIAGAITIDENGSLTIKDGGQLIHSNEGVVATVEKAIKPYTGEKDNYYLLSPSVNEADYYPDYEVLFPESVTNMLENEYDLYSFSYAAEDGLEWLNYKSESFSYMRKGFGYLYANNTNVTLSFTGVINPAPYNTLDYVSGYYLPFSAEGDYDFPNWTLAGNPYLCNVYLAVMNMNTNEFSYDFYVMNGDEIALNETGILAPMEGAFVISEAASTNVVVAQAAIESKNRGRSLNLSTTQNGKFIDRAIVRFGEGHGMPKFQLNPNHTKLFFTKDNKDYAVVYSDAQGEMPVSFKAESNGTYTLSVNSENIELGYLHLIDNMTGNDVDLLSNPSYTFEAKSTDYANRFKLVFATGNADDMFAFYSNGSFVINNEGNAMLQVIDVTGRIINSESINGCANLNVNAAPGVYMLRLVNGDNVKVQKVVVR